MPIPNSKGILGFVRTLTPSSIIKGAELVNYVGMKADANAVPKNVG